MDAVQKWVLRRRAVTFADTEIAMPTLAHIPGVEPSKRYCTAPARLERRASVHGSIKKPREMFASTRQARLVHLGKGRVMME